MRNLVNAFFDFLDPRRKGPLFWKYGWKGILFIILVTWGVHALIVSPKCWGISSYLNFFTLGVHEAGHPIFGMLFFGNFKMRILGGTLAELLVPLLGFVYFLHKGREIQADVCLLLLAIALHSIGFYAGYMFEDKVLIINGGPDSVPDWDYIHQWFHTAGHEWAVRHTLYWLSAFFTALGTYLGLAHFWEWNNPDKHDYGNDDDDGYGGFFFR